MQVLKRCQFFMQIANLCNKKNLYLFGFRVPGVIVNFAFSLPMSFCFVWMLIYCYALEFELKKISSAIYLDLGIFSILAIYICMAAKNNLIIKTVDHLQAIVDERKWINT